MKTMPNGRAHLAGEGDADFCARPMPTITMAPKIVSGLSVLIPTFRRPALLDHCLRSLADSAVRAQEVLVGDDGGDPGTEAVCASHARHLPIVRLPPAKRASLGANLTRLLVAAKGDWILLLHDDDFLVGDHSDYPRIFRDRCDFYFTDHWIAGTDGRILPEETEANTVRYGRNRLVNGIQQNVFDLALNKRFPPDGFYVRTSLARRILPDAELGPLADYFWAFRILNHPSRPVVCFQNRRTHAYRLSAVGLTASGIAHELNVLGYERLERDFPEHRLALRERREFYTWHAVNLYFRQKQRAKAWRLLHEIGFRYRRSLRRQLLVPMQALLLLLPACLSALVFRASKCRI
jgi:glycosyltransferase involved in cell wall biosynthesis